MKIKRNEHGGLLIECDEEVGSCHIVTDANDKIMPESWAKANPPVKHKKSPGKKEGCGGCGGENFAPPITPTEQDRVVLDNFTE